MRSQFVLLSAISLAFSGCGKSVERTAMPITQAQQQQQAGVAVQSTPSDTRPGQCHDPIQLGYKKIDRFSDIAMAIGSYQLTSFDAVGTATQAAGSPAAAESISVVSGAARAGGAFEYTEVCRDLSAMPEGSFQWSTVAPSAIDAHDGGIAEEVQLAQTVYGPSVMDPNGPRPPEKSFSREVARGCTSATSVMDGRGCAPATFYQIDSSTIGVLRVSQSSMNGIAVQSKIFAKYALNGGNVPTNPTPTRKPTPHQPTSHKHPRKPTNDGGQGKTDGGQGKTDSTHNPIPKPDNGGQGKTDGGQGPTTRPLPPVRTHIPPCCKNPNPSKTTTTTTTTVSIPVPTETSKTKLHVKQVTVDQTVSGDDVTKVKLTEKVKTNGETGAAKEKSDLKIKETSPEGDLKIKDSEKLKTNTETGDVKLKSDVKIKETTPTSSMKFKFKLKEKKKGKKLPSDDTDSN